MKTLREKENYIEDLLPNKTPSRIILHYSNLEIPVKEKEDIKEIMELMCSMVVVEEEINENMQGILLSIDLVYKEETIPIIFTVQGVNINESIYNTNEEMPLIFLCKKIADAEMQKYLGAKDDLIHIVDLFPEEKFEEVLYYYMGEAVSVTDVEIIAQANDMFESFYGEEVVLEEEYYGGYSFDLVYKEEVVRIFFQGNRIGIDGKVYWIREDISPFRDLIGEAAVAIYENQQ